MQHEPFLTADLEDAATGKEEDAAVWYAKALRSLAAQLGLGNDFFYPLIGAAQILETKSK